jgi:hypothetical protein
VQPLEFGDRLFRRLQRDRAEASEAVGVAANDIGDLVVDRACRGQSQVRIRTVIGLPRRRRNRLDVDSHQVHVGDALLRRRPLRPCPHAVLAIDLATARVGLCLEKPARDGLVVLDHRRGLEAGHMAMDVEGEPLAAGMRGTRKASRDRCPFRQTGEQHL